jgi:hypothetical protein
VSYFVGDIEGLSEARKFLRDMQAQHPTPAGLLNDMLGRSMLDASLAELNKRRVFEPTGDSNPVFRDGMAFDPKLETQRIDLADELIRRSDPGPFEDPRYLALLAYQAASLEMALPETLTQGIVGTRWGSILLGTIHAPEVNSFERTFARYGYTVVCLNSGLIEFGYQAAKVVTPILISHPDRRGRLALGEMDVKEIEARLAKNPEPVERLYRTLEAYYFKGYPRAFIGETVPGQQIPMLKFLTDLTERWVIAHEYGHGMSAGFQALVGAQWPASRYAEEYFADLDATILTALSATKLDGVPPEFALMGGTFALACLEVVQRGLAVVRDGKDSTDRGDQEHPPEKDRALFIFDNFNRYLVIKENPYGPGDMDVAFIAHPTTPPAADPAMLELRRKRVFQFPNALLAVWQRAEPRLQADFTNGRPLHAIWKAQGAAGG